ncbi:MAG TPA: 2,3-bisphosphoglycerate-dependent phosphoglycerate mutase [Candidatus Saccharimonadales bacterium]
MEKKSGILAISRHAESEWNSLGKWTGLTDVNLSEKGHAEAELLGEVLRGIPFDAAYHSEQKRTHQTLNGILKAHGQTDLAKHQHGAINERDYGDLTGKNKWEVQAEIGDEAFKGIRRGWDYPVPGGETLKDVHGRVVPFFDAEILPRLQEGENILLVAHGNSIRALIKHLDDIEESAIADVEMPLGQILLYHVTPQGTIDEKQVLSIDTTSSKA